ncbi:MAG: T9SS type A sorting domain-containing protein, partial [bacterium]
SQEGKSFCPIEEWVVNNEVRSESEVDEFNPLKHKDGWAIQLSVKAGSLTDEFNFIGVSKNAVHLREIPMLSVSGGQFATYPFINLYFTGKYAFDYRSKIEKEQIWEFTVESSKSGDMEINWQIDEVPEGYYLYLKDKLTSKIIDLRKVNFYQYKSAQDKREFSLIVAETPLPEIKAPSSLQEAFCYPNPTRGDKIIFRLPAGKFRIKIYNIAGEEVFEKEEIIDGWDWGCINKDNERVSSGIYIYILSDGKMTKTGKLGIIK